MSGCAPVDPACDQVALSTDQFRDDVLAGLSAPKKSLPCKYLYDDKGAELFEAICELEEYYPTRTELDILQRNIDEITSLIGPNANLVDLGSGNGLKIQLLLDHLEEPASLSAVDVAHTQLLESALRLARAYPALLVEPICADYTQPFELPSPRLASGRTTVFFPGSTIGNFEPEDAVVFLQQISDLCSPTGGLLVGIDRKKSSHLLHRAYNDAQGVTAQFNLNLLARINRELQAGFDLRQFHHRALYNAHLGRIEMHLVSSRREIVPVDGHQFAFAKGESIVTEHSYKYTLAEFRRLASRGGFKVARHWSDPRRWFSVLYLIPRQDGTSHATQAGK